MTGFDHFNTWPRTFHIEQIPLHQSSRCIGIQRKTVESLDVDVILRNATQKVDYVKEVEAHLSRRNYRPALVHPDLDVLDESLGKVNGYESNGGPMEQKLLDSSIALVPSKASPVSLTVCSFDPNSGDRDKAAKITVRAITIFVQSLIESDVLQGS